MSATTITAAKQSRGQVARMGRTLDVNLAFARAYTMFVRRFKRDPNWKKTSATIQITSDSVVCEFLEV